MGIAHPSNSRKTLIVVQRLMLWLLCNDQYACTHTHTHTHTHTPTEAAILTMEAGPDCDNHVVAQGSCLHLTCSSRPRGTLTWARADGQPIRTRPPSCSSTSSSSSCPQSVSGDGNLVLESVTSEDAGYYICTASFLNQTAMKICHVSVAGEVSKLIYIWTEMVPHCIIVRVYYSCSI